MILMDKKIGPYPIVISWHPLGAGSVLMRESAILRMSSRSYLSNRWKSYRIRVSARFGPDGMPVTLVDLLTLGEEKKEKGGALRGLTPRRPFSAQTLALRAFQDNAEGGRTLVTVLHRELGTKIGSQQPKVCQRSPTCGLRLASKLANLILMISF